MRLAQPACLARLVFCASCLMASVAMATEPDEPTPLGANAALQYWQAFSQLPAISADQEKLFASVDSASVQKPEALKLTQESVKSLMYLQRGALQTQCDWGLDYHDGIALLLPHLAKGRDLARLATLDARQTFERRGWAAGWSRATDTMALGRHVARDPFLVGLMVGAGIEDMAISAVTPYLPEMKLSYSQAAADIGALPHAATFTDALRIERKYITEWIIRKLHEEELKGGDAWKVFLDGSIYRHAGRGAACRFGKVRN